MKRVVLLKSNLGAKGGLEKYTLRIAKAFRDSHCKVTILTSSSKKTELPTMDGIEVISLFDQGFLSALNLFRFDHECTKWFYKNSFDILFGLDRNRHQTHYRAGNGVHATYLNSRKNNEGKLKSLSFSINPLHQLILNFERTCFEDPLLKVLFTNSHMVKDDILKTYHTESKKIQVVHNGVEWNEFTSNFIEWKKVRPHLLQRFHLNETSFQLLFVGHGYKRKGLELLLNALSCIKEENFQLSVVGKDKNFPYFKKLVNDLKLSEKVHFFGAQANIRPFYQLADALVIPSTYDPFANVTVEALAMGLSILSSRFNGGHEILKDFSGIVINDLFNKESLALDLKKIFERKKTESSTFAIRESVKHLDFSHQLNTIVQNTLS